MRSISEMSYANIEIIFQKVLSFLCVMVYNICIEFVRGVFMKFCDKLNEYIETLSCTSKELCELSGISEATFSRYKRGERVPEIGTDAFENLCTAVSESAKRREREDITARSVRESFISCEDFVSADKEILRQNFNALIASLGINLTKLCRATNYDVSTVFRIRSGTRRPADPGQFADAIASFVAREIKLPSEITALSELLGCRCEDISDQSARYTKLRNWLLNSGSSESGGSICVFLNKLDEFDLNEYIKAIRFDEIKVPTVPFQLPSSKEYFGLAEMMESKLDFLKATVLSKSMRPVTMYSDMPMTEMAKDPDFPKKWMFGMAMLLRKGLHLNQIHNLDRSFEDMMLGLESWIPMYMTGQISPYYLKNVQNNVFLHFLKVSGAAALSGEAIAGYHSDGKYYLTKSKKEIEYYEKRAQELLSNAKPLMDIYRSDRENEFNAFLLADAGKPGKRRSIFSALPMYTMSGELLSDILDRRNVPDDDRRRIFDHWMSQRRRVERILETESIEDEISDVTKEEFESRPISLDLSGAFFEADISYSYEDYLRHSEETEEFAASHPNYTLKKTSSHVFRNLQIHIHEGQWAMVSKGKAPAIHFVVQHPKLRGAIESFIPPVVEH